MPSKVDATMEAKSTPCYTILKRTQSNPAVSLQTKKVSNEIVPENSCENKFIVSESLTRNVNETGNTTDDIFEESVGYVIVKPSNQEFLYTRACHRSVSCTENLDNRCKIAKSRGFKKNDSHCEDYISPQKDKENVNPVRILQKPTSSTSIIKMTVESSAIARVLTPRYVENSQIESERLLNSNPIDVIGKTVPAVEDKERKNIVSNKGWESVRTSKSITILKRPERVLNDSLTNNNVVLIDKSDPDLGNTSKKGSLNMKTTNQDEIQNTPENIKNATIHKETKVEEIQLQNETQVRNVVEYKIDYETEVLPTNITILKRPDSSTHHLVENKSGQNMKTLEQRQKEYDEARMRIFGEFSVEKSSQDRQDEKDNDSDVNNEPTPVFEILNQISKETNMESVDRNTVSELNPEFPEFCPKGKANFYVDVDSNTTNADQIELSRLETHNHSNNKIYSNGSQHPLQYYHQPAPNVKHLYNGFGQTECYYSQFDFSSNFGPFPYGGFLNFDYIPFGSSSNFYSNPDVFIPNCSSHYADSLYPNFCSYDHSIPTNFMGFPNYVCDNFAYDFVTDSVFYSYPGTGYPDNTQNVTTAYQRSSFFDLSTVH